MADKVTDALIERLRLHRAWRDSHGELNDAPLEAADRLEALAMHEAKPDGDAVERAQRSIAYGRSFLEHIARTPPSDLDNPIIAESLLAVAAAGVKAMDDPDTADAETRAALATFAALNPVPSSDEGGV